MKKITNINLFALSLGCIIGWGAFVLPGNIFISMGFKEVVFGFIAMLLLLIPIVLSYHKLYQKYPDNSGGEFFYIFKELGKFHGYIAGSLLLFAYISIVVLNLLNFPLAIKFVLPDLNNIQVIVIMAIICLVFVLLYLLHINFSFKVQTVLSLYLFFSIFIVFMIFILSPDINRSNIQLSISRDFNLLDFMRVLSLAPFLFIGFDTVVQFSERALNINSKITLMSIFFGGFIYIALFVVALIGFNIDTVAQSTWAVGQTVMKLGLSFFYVILLALIIAIISGINGFLLSSVELMNSISNEGMLPKSFMKKNKAGSYTKSLFFLIALIIVLVLLGRSNIIILADAASIGITIVYFYIGLITIKYNKLLGYGSLFTSSIFLFLLILPSFTDKISSFDKKSYLVFILWILLVMAVYFYNNKNKLKDKN